MSILQMWMGTVSIVFDVLLLQIACGINLYVEACFEDLALMFQTINSMCEFKGRKRKIPTRLIESYLKSIVMCQNKIIR